MTMRQRADLDLIRGLRDEDKGVANPVAALLADMDRLNADQLPALLLSLAACLARTSARLLKDQDTADSPADPDANLSVEQAAQRLGVSPDWLYRNHRQLPFTRRIGRRLLFSSRGLERWNARPR